MENDEVTRRRDLLIQWSKRVRKIWRDLIPGSKKCPPSNAIGTPLEFLSKSKTAHAPASLQFFCSFFFECLASSHGGVSAPQLRLPQMAPKAPMPN